MLLSLIFAVILSILAVFFANDNQEVVRFQLYGLQLQSQLGIVIVTGFALGAVAGIVVMLPAYLSKAWSLIRSRRKVEDLERASSSMMGSSAKEV